MCGIAGWVGGASSEPTIQKMTDCIRHRGPDDSGSFVVPECTLGSRRLSIIDVAGGHMPIYNADKTLAIVFNGEIYNFADTRKELQDLGYSFSTTGDTEVVLLAYEEWGSASLNKHNGMFAFAIWDDRKKEMFAARDRLGIKPFYYTEAEGVLVFGSEIKSLLLYPGVERRLNEDALDQYFTFRYTPESDSIFAGISKLLPGHSLHWKEGSYSIERYWDVNFEPTQMSLENAQSDFVELFQKSVERRLISEVPLGALLSGGLDSSFIVSVMAKALDKPVETFSVGFNDKAADESEYAQEVAEAFNTNHHTLQSDPSGLELLPEILWHLDEPLADAAVIPTYQISELVRKHVTVVLSGEGADELLAGYDKLFFLHYANLLKRWFGWAAVLLPGGSIYRDRLKSFLRERDGVKAYFGFLTVFTPKEKQRLYTSKLSDKLSNTSAAEELIAQYVPVENPKLHHYLDLDLHTWLPNDLLLKGDRMTMAHSLEGRVPFLDHELVEFAAQLPNKLRIRGRKNKYLLRRVIAGILPKRIVKRKKHGFSVPLEMYRETIADILSPAAVSARGLFDPAVVSELVASDYTNQYYRRQVWSLVVFELWAQLHLDGDSIDVVRGRIQGTGTVT